jgi:hypothetical protein
MYPGQLQSFVHATTVTLKSMNVRDMDPENCRPSEISSRSTATRTAQLWKDYMPFGKEAALYVAFKLMASLGYVSRFRMLLMDSSMRV